MTKNQQGGGDGDRTDRIPRTPGDAPRAKRRRERLAAELRANLLKRKTQSRSRALGTSAAPEPDDGNPG